MHNSVTNKTPKSKGFDHLDSIQIANLEQVAIEAVIEGGKIAKSKFHSEFTIFAKGAGIEDDVVTSVDHSVQSKITAIIRGHFPKHAILGEEDKSDECVATDFLWSIDPIDGTRNFACGASQFGISVAVLYRGEPIAGAIWNLSYDDPGYSVTHARRSGGTWVDGQRVHLNSTRTVPTRSLHAILPPNFFSVYTMKQPLSQALGEVRIVGSIAWETAMLVQNVAQYVVTAVCHHWDVAAAKVIVEEAGGVALTSDKDGILRPFKMWSGENYENDIATFKKMRNWHGNFVASSPNMAQFLHENLKLGSI